MARLLKIDLAGNIPVRTFVTFINFSSCYHFIYHTQNTLRRVDAIPTLRAEIDEPSTPWAFCVMPNPSTSDLLKEIELLRQINAIQQQTIDSLTKSQQNILNNLLRKDNRVPTSITYKINLN